MGNPVVVSLGDKLGQPGHFVAVTGISSGGELITYNDPLSGKEQISLDEFLAQWELKWHMLVIMQETSFPPNIFSN